MAYWLKKGKGKKNSKTATGVQKRKLNKLMKSVEINKVSDTFVF